MPNPLFPPGSDFCWATGIEDTFIPQARPGLRPLDEYELTQHYAQWETDLTLAESLGVRAVRWGIPWYRVQPAPDRFDWDWTDRVLEAMVERFGLVPILDLMHYGTPHWLDNSFINSAYPQRVAEYAAAVARRYQGLVSVFTPLNEPAVNAEFCGLRGEWPPYLVGDDGYVKVALSIARGIVQTVQAIRAEHPEPHFVQVEALWHNWTHDPRLQGQVAQQNEKQYLVFDLVTGRMNESHPLMPFLLGAGVSPQDFDWFLQNSVSFDIFGANFYPWSYGEVALNEAGRAVRLSAPTPGSAIAGVVQDAHRRYGLPVMVTETSSKGAWEARAAWMDETLSALMDLRRQGVPVVGYTWFPMMTMIDWAYRTGQAPIEEYLLHLGLFDSHFDSAGVLQRTPTPLAGRYRQYTSTPV